MDSGDRAALTVRPEANMQSESQILKQVGKPKSLQWKNGSHTYKRHVFVGMIVIKPWGTSSNGWKSSSQTCSFTPMHEHIFKSINILGRKCDRTEVNFLEIQFGHFCIVEWFANMGIVKEWPTITSTVADWKKLEDGKQ